MAMRILVTGRQGQLACCLADRSNGAHEIVAVGRPELDIEKRETIAAAIAKYRPDVLVNPAAYTAVDRAETEEDAAFAVNALGAENAAAAAADTGLPIIHISTDYVFAGDKPSPYVESDPTDPAGAYGRTKLEGERRVLAANPRSVVLRTAWVFSAYGGNFLKTMLRLAGERDSLRIVADQHGTPTYGPDIAAGVIAVADRMVADRDGDWPGIYHMVAHGETSWAGFAEAIFAASRDRGGAFADVVPITTAEYPTPARRPANSRLDTKRFEAAFGHQLPNWQDGVLRCLGALVRGHS